MFPTARLCFLLLASRRGGLRGNYKNRMKRRATKSASPRMSERDLERDSNDLLPPSNRIREDGLPQSSGSFQEETNQEELRCVIAVIRHGDRTPKQKLKMDVAFPQFLDFHKKLAVRKNIKVFSINLG